MTPPTLPFAIAIVTQNWFARNQRWWMLTILFGATFLNYSGRQTLGVAVPIMENRKILVVATHGPTVVSIQALLQETADRLGEGQLEVHNEIIANATRQVQQQHDIYLVLLAQLSMSLFSFSYPDPVNEFGVPVPNSGETGFRRVSEVLMRAIHPAE